MSSLAQYVHEEKGALERQVGGEHYKEMAIEPLEFFFANSNISEILAAARKDVQKYIWRKKAGMELEDWKKAKHYIELAIEQMEKVPQEETLKYNFPATKFVENDMETQLHHISSEIREALAASNYQEALIESLDVCHSAETYLRILVKRYGAEAVAEGMREVVAKNKAREYYTYTGGRSNFRGR